MRRWIALGCVAGLTAWATPASAVKFRFPLDDPDGTHVITLLLLGVDHDPVDLSPPNVHCLAYDCKTDFPFCYDQHRGTDYPLDGSWEAMEADSLPIVAAADGDVIAAEDGNYDHCHADIQSGGVTCDGYPMQANHVAIRHADGTVSEYYHLRKGSVLPKVGDHVTCGQPIGLIGSSGNSAMPHLHFQVETPAGDVVDPYAGACSQALSYWVVQDGPNGLPGPWCEGAAIPEWVEPVPEESLEVSAVEEAPVAVEEAVVEVAGEEPGSGVDAAAEGVMETIGVAEPPADDVLADPVADAASVPEPVLTGGSGGGCAAGRDAGAGAVAWILFAGLAVLRRRASPWRPSMARWCYNRGAGRTGEVPWRKSAGFLPGSRRPTGRWSSISWRPSCGTCRPRSITRATSPTASSCWNA